MTIEPRYHARFEPVYPCREMPTRHCPAVYDAVCGVRPCARFESRDESPWAPEIEGYWELKHSGLCDSQCMCFASGCQCSYCKAVNAQLDIVDMRTPPKNGKA